ncbi:MAG TPA: ATPase, T2SS/T4P/T4SS family [Verrucomicrobiae bacterium]|nr:ATPase, T2SS/T4P/T4SS family [Verrucomicrobiae bacterium]
MKSRMKIGQHLVEKGLITEDQLKQALDAQAKKDRFLGEIFVENGWVTEEQLMESLAEQFKMQLVRLAETAVDPKLKEVFPLKVALHYKVMPLELKGTQLTIAIAAPQDILLLDHVSLALRQKYVLNAVLATGHEIDKAISRFYGLGAETVDRILLREGQPQAQASAEPAVQDIQKSEEASVVKLVNQFLLEAYQRRATDIHLEPFRDKIRLRYRVDGVLETADLPDTMRRFFPAIISRIKVLSGLNLVEKRAPQDGRGSVTVGSQKLDLRVSVLPSSAGEGVVIRILPNAMLYNLSELGLERRNLEIMQKMLAKPYGLMFVTGPTGSGKTTTLYSALKQINTEERKIITIEDPVEYELPGIMQVPVNPQVGMGFAQGLRSMLRHDPDVMMVGEVRDVETAELAIRIALTGHLVLSTLHTNDAASGFARLTDMGIPPYLLASSVSCLVAQRLIRKICDKCRQEVPGVVPRSFHGEGCNACHRTGYNGRMAIYEVLPVTAEIKKLVLQKASVDEIRQLAVDQGMTSLQTEGWAKVKEGLTSPEEVLRITSNETMEI